MRSLPELIEELSNDGCTDVEAVEISIELIKMDIVRERLGDELDSIKLKELVSATNKLPEQEAMLYKVLSILSPRERECYLLHTIQLMSMGKIADKLQIAKGSVQQYIERARDKINNYRGAA